MAWDHVDSRTQQPRKIVQSVRPISDLVRADGLIWTPEAIARVEAADAGTMDAVIDRIMDVPGVLGTDSRMARWSE